MSEHQQPNHEHTIGPIADPELAEQMAYAEKPHQEAVLALNGLDRALSLLNDETVRPLGAIEWASEQIDSELRLADEASQAIYDKHISEKNKVDRPARTSDKVSGQEEPDTFTHSSDDDKLKEIDRVHSVDSDKDATDKLDLKDAHFSEELIEAAAKHGISREELELIANDVHLRDSFFFTYGLEIDLPRDQTIGRFKPKNASENLVNQIKTGDKRRELRKSVKYVAKNPVSRHLLARKIYKNEMKDEKKNIDKGALGIGVSRKRTIKDNIKNHNSGVKEVRRALSFSKRNYLPSAPKSRQVMYADKIINLKKSEESLKSGKLV